MDERSRAAWLLRRAGFGALPGEVDAVAERGTAAWLDDQLAATPVPDGWDDDQLGGEPSRETREHAIGGWLDLMRDSTSQLVERMAWVWHDHFATSMDKVFPLPMVQQVRTLRAHALGSFRELLRATTVDAAMLRWLDGATSTKRSPNENHGRELLELFAVGVGNHTEDDVAAAARALTGWVVPRGTARSTFVRRRHDDTAQVLLGTGGVHDVDTVVDAACASPACATFVTESLARHLLGPAAAANADLVGDLAADFRAGDLAIGPLVRSLLEAGLARDDTAVVEAPVPWLVRAERATGARLAARPRIVSLNAMGQVPMRPPDVGGWPDHTSWLASATVVARLSVGAGLAAASPSDGEVRAAARRRDLDALAAALGRVEGFAATTESALRSLRSDVEVVGLALAAPDQVVI